MLTPASPCCYSCGDNIESTVGPRALAQDFSSRCLSPDWHLLLSNSMTTRGWGLLGNPAWFPCFFCNVEAWWCTSNPPSASMACPVRKHLGYPQGRLPVLPTSNLGITQGVKRKGPAAVRWHGRAGHGPFWHPSSGKVTKHFSSQLCGECKAIVHNLIALKLKSPGPDGFTGKYYQICF